MFFRELAAHWRGQTAGATATKSTGTSRSFVCQQRRGQDGVSAAPTILFPSSSSVQAIPLARVLYHCDFTITHVTSEPLSVFVHVTANITRLPAPPPRHGQATAACSIP